MALENVDDIEEAVGRLVDTYVDYALANSGLFRLMFGHEPSRAAHPELFEGARASFEVFSDTMDRYCDALGVPAERRDLVTMTAWSLEHGLALLLLSRQIPLSLKPVEEQALRAEAKSIFLRGVRGLVSDL